MIASRPTPTSAHGTLRFYLIGFTLSLICTVIPYYLVVHRPTASHWLPVVILSFAALQMLVQIFFFLHLGRGPKPFYNIVFFSATVGLIVIAIGGSLFIMDHLYRNMSPDQVTKKLAQDEGIAQVGGQKTGACQGIKANHLVTISGGKVTPQQTNAHRCDTLTFMNNDKIVRDIAFGSHPTHEVYGGEVEEIVRVHYPKTITLNQVGDYTFHDHLDPTVSGRFSVEP